ncbi:fasciclin domain-containing protein [Peristeroidobacter agariperforans]|uniref:fasciclin domain-containing protein n=1 Tax=Peristeroidobacter agariperforans TaxID=268404 RepID=UPI0018E55851|nr:fasciclin domain-containing protein [Peristeroidobacter agariperforans]
MKRLTHVALATMAVATGFASTASAEHPQPQGAVRPAFTQVQRVDGTIVDVAVGNPAFSTLVTALQAADLVTTLQGPGPFTVFAPTNEAFKKIPAGVLNFLLADQDALTDVLLYHVVPGVRDLRYQFSPRDLRTVQEQDVYVDRERDILQINNSLVSGQVIRTDNGIIYVVDSVLLPQYR